MSINFNNHNIYTSGVISAASGIFSTLQVNSIPPSLPTSSGTAGQIAYDNDYLYVATSGNTWKRVALSSWSADPYCSDVSLLLHMDGSNGSTTFTDSSSSGHTLTANGDAQIQTSESQFGGASAYFDGSGDSISAADSSALELGSQNFTIEMWIKTSNSTQYATLVSRSPASFASGMWSLLMNFDSSTAGDLKFYCADANGGVSAVVGTSGVSVRDNQWHHIALVRSGTNHYIFVDGTQYGSSSISAYTIADISGDIYIGADQHYGRHFTGYIDELRITKMARYTSSFTPSSTAFPSCSLS